MHFLFPASPGKKRQELAKEDKEARSHSFWLLGNSQSLSGMTKMTKRAFGFFKPFTSGQVDQPGYLVCLLTQTKPAIDEVLFSARGYELVAFPSKGKVDLEDLWEC